MLPDILFDIETDGLLDTVSTIHLLVIQPEDSEEQEVYRRNDEEDTIPLGIERLRQLAAAGHQLVAHNGIGYDYPALAKLAGLVLPWEKCLDSMVHATLAWPDIAGIDLERRKKPAGKNFPGNLIGSYSLEAFGHRLGLAKGDYRGDTRIEDEKARYAQRWLRWNPDMETYGCQDVRVLRRLWLRIKELAVSPEAASLETQVAHILARQERYGFYFHEDRAVRLYTKLVARKLELEDEVKRVFRPRFLPAGVFTPKRDNKASGYVADAPLTKVVLTEFNPGSRDHVSRWLRLEHGWVPEEFTADGKPKVDDEVISKLDYPEVASLKEYFLVTKRIGQVAEGNEAWLKKVGKDGRMHGRVHTNKAVTGRMAHSGPNMGQVPAAYSPYGKECRECFGVPPGKTLVGVDADALELRDLAGYMAPYDGGAYVRTVLEGNKANGTDMHSVNARALGLDPKSQPFLATGDTSTGRDIAKTWFYAFIYGAGDEKLGSILTRQKGRAATAQGKRSRDAFLRNLPAMGKLVERVKAKAKEVGFLRGLDGRRLTVRSQHAALNTLLQSAGAVQMKRALCIFDELLQARGLVPGVNYEFVANVHDEWQLEVDDEHAETVEQLGCEAIRLAGESFGFLCPLAGSGGRGKTWADTH